MLIGSVPVPAARAAEVAPSLPALPREVRIPVRAAGARGPAFTLQAFVYAPPGRGRHPLLVFSHGSAGGDPKQPLPQADLARSFARRGFVVIVPMRRGRGASGGTSLEFEERNCDPAAWWPGLHTAYGDLTATIAFAAALPGVDASHTVLAGESRGGFLSVAYAAEGAARARVVGVVNFVGGWVAQAEDRCPVDLNALAFRRFAAATRLPELWLYGDGDRFYSTRSIRRYAQDYARAGGTVTFDLVARVPNNGHWLPGFPSLWTTQLDRYLAARGLPGARSRQ